MTDREKALEAALRDIARQRKTDEMSRQYRRDADFDGAYDTMIDVARAALAMPADDRTAWEAGRDAAADYVQEMAPSYKEYDSGRDALNDAVDAIRNLTPPEDAP